MDDHGGEQDNARDPQRRPERLQEVRVAVDVVGGLEDLEIPDQVPDDEANEDDAGDGHENLAADGRAKKIHRK